MLTFFRSLFSHTHLPVETYRFTRQKANGSTQRLSRYSCFICGKRM